MHAYQRPYGLGDAQIDAQNNVVRSMGNVLDTLQGLRNTSSITRTHIYNASAEMQNFINDYAKSYGNTSRGSAGLRDLQNLFSKIQADLNREFAALPEVNAPVYITSGPTGDLNASPIMQPYNPNVDYTINVGGTSPSTAANIQPSQTPGPPAGIDIAPDAPAPSLLENPYVWAAAGLALLVFFNKRGNA